MARFDPDQIIKRTLDKKRRRVEDRLQAIRCPDHGSPIQFRFTGDGNSLRWEISGCCEKVREAGRAAFREPG